MEVTFYLPDNCNAFLEKRLLQLMMKRKLTWRIALISVAHIEQIGELEGKKSLFEDTIVFSELRWSGKNPATFV